MLPQTTKELLKSSKNLLAFSAGVDSTALLFLLLENDIKFDIAIIDYGLREQSKEEVAYAKELASKYNFECFIKTADPIKSNFEATARKIRYDFFEELIRSRNYDNLLTAHHLGDRLEWMLMQFCKGAGCVELNSLKMIDSRQGYMLVRPLLQLDKQELLAYLKAHKIHYFLDVSNEDESYSRNYFRKHYARPLLEKYLSGIKRSFAYMDEDVNALIQECEIKHLNKLAYFVSRNSRHDIYHIDKYLKSLGHIITSSERRLLKTQDAVVIGRKYIVCRDRNYLFIAPYVETKNFSKDFKEKMRKLKIEPKLRGYLAFDAEAVDFLFLLFS